MAKTDNDEAYERGFKDGVHGGLFSDFVRSVSDSVPLPESKREEIYNKGYDEGARRRYDHGDDDDSDSDSGGGSSDTCCFITTACLRSLNLPLDSLEFRAVKTLTKNHILKSMQGKRDYIKYGRISPDIVRKIESSGNQQEIWQRVYERLQETARFVDEDDLERGYQEYKRMVVELDEEFN